jgi:hypothetical protein
MISAARQSCAWGGLTKPVRSPASPSDYRRIRQYADEFRKRRTVYQQDPGR